MYRFQTCSFDENRSSLKPTCTCDIRVSVVSHSNWWYIMQSWPKEGQLAQTWSGHLVHKQASKPVWKICWQNTNGPLPVSHFQTQLPSPTYGLDHTVQNQPRSDPDLPNSVRFLAKQIWSESKLVWLPEESLGLLPANASEPVQTGCESELVCLLGSSWSHHSHRAAWIWAQSQTKNAVSYCMPAFFNV